MEDIIMLDNDDQWQAHHEDDGFADLTEMLSGNDDDDHNCGATMLLTEWSSEDVEPSRTYGSIAKRVSLDPSETWMATDCCDNESMHSADWTTTSALPTMNTAPCSLDEALSFPQSCWTEQAALHFDLDLLLQEAEHGMFLDDDSDPNKMDDSTTKSFQDLLAERQAALAASMRKSEQSRAVLSEHIKQRASLASVLADIERSASTLKRHLFSVEEGDDDEATIITTATPPAVPSACLSVIPEMATS